MFAQQRGFQGSSLTGNNRVNWFLMRHSFYKLHIYIFLQPIPFYGISKSYAHAFRYTRQEYSFKRGFIQIQKHLGSPVTGSQKISGILFSFPICLISLFGSFFLHYPTIKKQDFNFLSLYVFFLGKKPSYFYSCHAFETTICEFTWYITYKMFMVSVQMMGWLPFWRSIW